MTFTPYQPDISTCGWSESRNGNLHLELPDPPGFKATVYRYKSGAKAGRWGAFLNEQPMWNIATPTREQAALQVTRLIAKRLRLEDSAMA